MRLVLNVVSMCISSYFGLILILGKLFMVI